MNTRMLVAGVMAGIVLLCGWPTPAHPDIGLCCGKCGGNMPMSLPGGGIAETDEFRIMVMPMFVHMEGLGEGMEPMAAGSWDRDSHFATSTMDKGKFRTPTLRNVALTAPYMHDGAFRTLKDVVDFYDRGGGKSPFTKDSLIMPLHLSAQDKKDLVEFLKSLSGETRTQLSYRASR